MATLFNDVPLLKQIYRKTKLMKNYKCVKALANQQPTRLGLTGFPYLLKATSSETNKLSSQSSWVGPHGWLIIYLPSRFFLRVFICLKCVKHISY